MSRPVADGIVNDRGNSDMLLADHLGGGNDGLGIAILGGLLFVFAVRALFVTLILHFLCRLPDLKMSPPVRGGRLLAVASVSSVLSFALCIWLSNFSIPDQTKLFTLIFIECLLLIPVVKVMLPTTLWNSVILSFGLHFVLLALYGGVLGALRSFSDV